MDHSRNLLDVAVVQTERVRIRQHQSRDVVTKRGFQRFQVDRAIFVRFDFTDFVARHRRRRRVRSVSGVRDDDRVALRVAAIFVVCLDQKNSCQFAVSAGRGLERVGGHARHVVQQLFEVVEQLKVSLHRLVGLHGMSRRETRQGCHVLIDFRIVLHRARAERIRSDFDVIVLRRKIREVTNDGNLVHIGDIRFTFAIGIAEPLGKIRLRYVQRTDIPTPFVTSLEFKN
jgi:hypothetical protein